MKSIKILLVSISVIFSFVGCKKEHYDTAATVNSADPAGDGCGWSVVVRNVSYHADNLADKYKVPNLAIYLSYTITSEKYGCGYPPGSGGLPVIHITNIRKAN